MSYCHRVFSVVLSQIFVLTFYSILRNLYIYMYISLIKYFAESPVVMASLSGEEAFDFLALDKGNFLGGRF